MGSLRGRLRRLEEAAEEDTVVLVLQDTGEEIRVHEDAVMRWLVAEWRRGVGEAVGPDPEVEHLDALVPRGLREKNPDLDGRVFVAGDDARRRARGD